MRLKMNLGYQVIAKALDRAERRAKALVIGYQWEVNKHHPRLKGRLPSGGYYSGWLETDLVELGQRGPVFYEQPPGYNPWGLTQIWLLANGQEVRVTWKDRNPR